MTAFQDNLTTKQDDARKLFVQHLEHSFASFQRALVKEYLYIINEINIENNIFMS